MNIEVKDSPIHGLGVFARRTIPAGHCQYVYGDLIESDWHEVEHFCFEHDDDHMFLPCEPFLYLNHSATPNCVVEFDDDTYVIQAVDNILPGEELTIDYGYTP